MSSVHESVAVVTGAAGNLGRAVAAAFRDAGVRLVLVDQSLERLADLDRQPDELALGIDLLDQESVSEMCASIENRFGRLDTLFHAVGAFRGGRSVDEEPLATWDTLLDVNLRSAVVATQAVVPHMKRQGGGRVIYTASPNAFVGAPLYAAYSASKAAVVRLAESSAAELADHGITVNCLVPGTLDTPENRTAMPDADPSQWVALEAIADVALFLASPAARAINGASIALPDRTAWA